MAVNYTNLFRGLGELVQRAERYFNLYPGFDTDLSEIEADFQAIGRGDIFSGVPEIIDGFKSNVLQWIGLITSRSVSLLTERESILEELRLESPDLNTVLLNLYRDMVDQAVTINRSTVTIGAVTADKVNGNAGNIMIDKILDGTSAPGARLSVNWEYNGVNSELTGSETMFVQVVQDSSTDGQNEGNEEMRVFGSVDSGDPWGPDTFGSGPGPSFNVIQGASLGTNYEMENFTGNLPAGWDLDSGIAGTHVLEETSVLVRGVSALRFQGNSAQTSIQISQAIPTSCSPRTKYCVGFWVRGTTGISSGMLTIQFEGTGYTPGATEKISLNAAALSALSSYQWKYFFVNMPTQIPDDMALVIKWDGTPSTHSVYVDGGGIVQPVWHNGLSFAAYAGSEAFVKNDRFVFSVTNDEAGVFQRWFRKSLGFQMPSSLTPSISDSQAT